MIPFPKKKEFDYIQYLVQENSPDVLLGIGDDAAVIKPLEQSMVVAHDLMSEGVHFKISWSTPLDLAEKLLKSNLSDFEAMGAQAKYVLCSFAFSNYWSTQYIQEFLQAFRKSCDHYGLKIIGGDTSSALGNSTLGLTLLGYSGGNLLTRKTAQKNHSLYVSGFLGLSKAGLHCLENDLFDFPILVNQHLNPSLDYGFGAYLSLQNGVGAVMDLSDDLYSSLEHLALQSKCGFQLDFSQFPIHQELQRFVDLRCENPFEWILYGGEEYKLLFTADPSQEWITGLLAEKKIFMLGHVIEGEEIILPNNVEFQNLKKCEFQHFREAVQ